jgi:hypothetical protein
MLAGFCVVESIFPLQTPGKTEIDKSSDEQQPSDERKTKKLQLFFFLDIVAILS